MKAGRDLNILIAERVMGEGPIPNAQWFPPDMGGAWLPCYPCYSTDIVEAWRVVQRFVPHIRVECSADSAYYEVPEAKREPFPWHVDIWTEGQPVHCVVAPTAPLAICLAALKAVGVEMGSGDRPQGEAE